MKEEEFNYLTEKNGGKYTPNFNKEDILILEKLEYMNKFKRRIVNEIPNLPNIYLDIINNDKFNATAILSNNGNYYIGIFKGVILELDEFLSKSVKSEKFYKRFNMKKEKANEYKELCFNYALEFLVAHEISHIRFGHLALKKKSKKDAAFMYENYQIKSKEENIFEQTLEMDADCCGISTVFNRLLADINTNSHSNPIKMIKINIDEFIENPTGNIKLNDFNDMNFSDSIVKFMLLEERLFCLAFSINFINERLFKAEHKLLDLDDYDHPHPGLRQFYIQANINTILLRIFNENNADSNISVMGDAFISVSNILNENLDKKNIPMCVVFTEAGQKHMVELSEQWGVVREELKSCSFDGLAPYEKLTVDKSMIHFDDSILHDY